MPDWEISNSTGRCAVSGRELVEGEAFYAVLFDRGESFERLDYAEENWTSNPDGAFCVWRSRVPARDEPKRRFVDDDVLMDFFERLDRESEESKIQFRFVLALILMRKRILKYLHEENADGGAWWIMKVMGRFKSDDDERNTRRVLNPEMDEEQIEQVSRQLGIILTGDFSRFDEPDVPDEPDKPEEPSEREESDSAEVQAVAPEQADD